jgi:oxalate decarboxylase
MEASKPRVAEGGVAREATIKQLPISKGLAGVSMRLKPGGIRELHWHAIAAEWAFMIKGNVRTTVIGPESTSETNDFKPGDVWYFPRGHGHLLQNIGNEEAHFILIFDDGAFSEFGTFSTTDWLGHTSPRVLSKSLGLPESAFANFPKEELYIVNGRTAPAQIPPNHQKLQKISPQTHRHALMDQAPYETFRGGVEHRVTVKEFPISTTISGVIMDLDPGAVREPHWHPNADEWQYIISGQCDIGVFGSHGRARVEALHQGDAGYVPRGYGHYIENTGEKPLRHLIGFTTAIMSKSAYPHGSPRTRRRSSPTTSRRRTNSPARSRTTVCSLRPRTDRGRTARSRPGKFQASEGHRPGISGWTVIPPLGLDIRISPL